jgi:hypothetical protein
MFAMAAASPVAAVDGCTTQAIRVEAHADYNSNPIFSLHGDPGSIWTDSGFVLKAGESVTVTATGTAYSYLGLPVDPNGIGGGCPAFCGGPGLSTYSLIGRIGNGQPFFVGNGPVVLRGEGELYFAFNDGLYDDNSGSFSVTLAYGC